MGVEHGNALADAVERGLQQQRMRGQIAFAQAHFLALDVGDVGVNAHPAAVAGAPLADALPGAVGHRQNQAAFGFAVVGDAALQPAKRVVARFQHAAVADHGGDKILKMQAGADHAALIGKQIQKTAIAARQGVVRLPQGKAVGNGVHRHIQPALRGFGGALGLGQGKLAASSSAMACSSARVRS